MDKFILNSLHFLLFVCLFVLISQLFLNVVQFVLILYFNAPASPAEVASVSRIVCLKIHFCRI